MRTMYLRLAVILFCIIHASFCRSEIKIDSCKLVYTSPVWIGRCTIAINDGTGVVYTNDEPCKKDTLSADATKMILDGLRDIFIEKKHPIVKSKTKADDIFSREYPFLQINICYGRNKIDKFLYVSQRDETKIFHYSGAFIKLWDTIDKVVKDFLNEYHDGRLEYYHLYP